MKKNQDHDKEIVDIVEADFSYSTLNQVFWNRGAKGSTSAVVGGINVIKTVTKYTSNSGKHTDYQVVFSWIGTDGKESKVSKESVYSKNRRNDEKRNWGLPE